MKSCVEASNRKLQGMRGRCCRRKLGRPRSHEVWHGNKASVPINDYHTIGTTGKHGWIQIPLKSLRQCHARKTMAPGKSTTSYARHAFAYRHARKIATIPKCLISYTRHTIGYRYTREGSTFVKILSNFFWEAVARPPAVLVGSRVPRDRLILNSPFSILNSRTGWQPVLQGGDSRTSRRIGQ